MHSPDEILDQAPLLESEKDDFNDADTIRNTHPRANRKPWKNFSKIFGLKATLALVFFSVLLLIATTTTTKSRQSVPSANIANSSLANTILEPVDFAFSSCGTSPSEARQRGCHFDVLSFGWTPPECWDAEVYGEVTGSYNFTWTTLDSHESLTIEQVQTGNHEQLLSTWNSHLIACTYAWQKITRAALKQKPLDEWSARYVVAETCVRDLLDSERFDRKAMITLNQIWYPRCGLNQVGMLKILAADA
jgi:hypothetical protein